MTSATSCDEVAYPGFPYPQTHPTTLATLGHLYGLDVVPVDRCRVLELGCGDGQNLIAMAVGLPDSQFVGIDLSEAAIANGQRCADAVGLGNLRLLHRDVLAFDCEPGAFDYVIAHGLYSWVPPHVQAKVLALIQHCLSPSGIGYVSYNTLPGGHFRLLARELMQFHTRGAARPREQAQQGKALMGLLAQVVAKDKAYGAVIGELDRDLSRRVDEVLCHDELGEANENLYFHTFMARARAHGLQFLAEAVFMEMFPPDLEPRAETFLEQFETDVLAREQYLDFITGRRLRQTLLCHAHVPLVRQISLDRIARLHFAAALKIGSLALEASSPVEFEGKNGAVITVGHPLIKAALQVLHRHWPCSLGLDDLHAQAVQLLAQSGLAPEPFDREQDHVHLVKTLFVAFRGGLLELGPEGRRLVSSPGPRPLASPLARHQAGQGEEHVTTLLHRRWQIPGPFERELLTLLDGSRDQVALVAALAQAVQSGRLPEATAGEGLAQGPGLDVQARTDACLRLFARLGLLWA